MILFPVHLVKGEYLHQLSDYTAFYLIKFANKWIINRLSQLFAWTIHLQLWHTVKTIAHSSYPLAVGCGMEGFSQSIESESFVSSATACASSDLRSLTVIFHSSFIPATAKINQNTCTRGFLWSQIVCGYGGGRKCLYLRYLRSCESHGKWKLYIHRRHHIEK